MAKATPPRSGDYLAGIAATQAEQRVAAQMTLAALPLRTFLQQPVIPYESDEVTRLIIDTHDAQAFASDWERIRPQGSLPASAVRTAVGVAG